MKNRAIVVAAMALALAVPVFASGNAEAGKTIYMKHCNACHGPSGAGNPTVAKMMHAEIPALASKEVQSMSDADLKKVITDGKGKMRPVKDLSANDLNNVVAFVRSLSKK